MMRRALRLALFAAVVLVAAACGRSGYQYIENDDSTVFAKIPEEWEVVSEGTVDFSLTGEDGQISILPGDQTLPWRALFDAQPAADGSVRFDRVLGAVEVQPVDRRRRSAMSMATLLGFDPDSPAENVTVLRRADVRQGEFTGMRVTYTTEIQGVDTTMDRMILTDDRFTAVYDLRVFCDNDCFDENESVIDEIIGTFTVEAVR